MYSKTKFFGNSNSVRMEVNVQFCKKCNFSDEVCAKQLHDIAGSDEITSSKHLTFF